VAAGLDYNTVINRIVDLAVQRHQSRLTHAKLAKSS
jgi:hypothetical protein